MFAFLGDVASKAGELAKHFQQTPDRLVVEAKAPLDIVTAADRAVEALIVSTIHQAFPSDAFLGEEGAQRSGSSGRLWVIDPIDGTANYMHDLPWWAISIGLLQDGKPAAGIVHAPAMGITLSAVVGQGVRLNGQVFTLPPCKTSPVAPIVFTGCAPGLRAGGLDTEASQFIRDHLSGVERNLGSATASLLQVLSGHAHLYLGFGENLWDVCTGAIIADELGLMHSLDWETAADGAPFNFTCGMHPWIEQAKQKLVLV
ncbi:inositol monophosphatase family protein [Phyllobacterium endophyticum]|uniref:Inositol-1-monophosphatase n=1 Tax=Phyllobacterium endophyticum TaxID=1149773 RepID=A0A2P7B1X9_9HYPH|nr:inositol monophosphatase family protein [Phyllobacterium endophyticum]MBB3238037.1 myo-inositol-1(or 4)-monophosphatase [Phyllobacterium endophyticum]PSH60452.1 hypothetical protein CU100_07190 [Phyllobacterium endophyticum]TYR42630.1 inositol monophosphatase family protein [Phyllobacterium endophyticum]